MPENIFSRNNSSLGTNVGGPTGIQRIVTNPVSRNNNRGTGQIGIRRPGRRNDTVVPDATIQIDSSGQINPNGANAMANDPAKNQLLTASLDSLIPVLYGGPERLAGKLYIPKLYGNVLYLSIILCQGEIEQIGTAAGESSNGIFLNDADLAGSTTHTFHKYLGTAGQLTDSWLSAVITSPVLYNETLANTAYIVCQMAPSTTGFPRLVFTVKGRKIYDPRSNIMPWSNLLSSWTSSGTLTINQNAVGPWGATNYAWTISDTDAAVQSGKTVAIVVPNNSASYTFAFKVRRTVGNAAMAGMNFSFAGGTSKFCYARVNPNDGSVNSGNVTGFTATEVGQTGDKYWLCEGSITNNGLGNTTLGFAVIPASGASIFADNAATTGTNVFTEIQIRLSTKPRGYIETPTAVAVDQPTVWSDNAGLILGDFLSSSVYGENRTVNAQSLAYAAEYSDEMLGLVGAPNEKRAKLTILIDHRQNVRAWRDVIRQYVPAWVTVDNGEAIIRIDRDEPMDHTFTSLNARQNPLVEINRNGSGETPNAVIISYTDTSVTPYKTSTVESNTGENPRRVTRIDMPGLRSNSAAKRMSILRLNHYTLEDLTGTFPLFDEGLKVLDGDLAQITDEIGITNQKTRILSVADEGHGRWSVYFRKHDPAVYSNLVVAPPTTPELGPPNPNSPPAVAGLALFEDRRQESGVWVSRVRATWNDPQETYPYVDFFVVQLFDAPFNGTYSHVGPSPDRLQIVSTAHGRALNDLIYLDFTSGGGVDTDMPVTNIINANTFEVYYRGAAGITPGNVTWRLLREHYVTKGNTWISQPVVLSVNYMVRVRIKSTAPGYVIGP